VACSLYLVRAHTVDSRSGLDWQHLGGEQERVSLP
jgi:hypothetical protein